jgi:P4 family phage/plasmid primase-like protien
MSAQTFDLRTGVGRKPDPRDYLTKAAGTSCAPPGTPHPLWDKFLDDVTAKNRGLQGFLQRYIGYCFTGFTHEHVFVFAWGTGANGKSTFINTISRVFGDYTTVADMGTFLASHGERHPTDLAKLMGARLVVAQEIGKGRRWDETKIKALTGGDPISARFMPRLLRLHPNLQAFHRRKPQTAARKRRRGDPPPHAARPVHRADTEGATRPAAAREAMEFRTQSHLPLVR